MKIRWTHKSIRFRINAAELELLSHGKEIAVRLPLGTGWRASILPAQKTSLQLQDGHAQIQLAPDDLHSLLQPQNEGVYFRTEGSSPIRYLIEKDQPCAHPKPLERSFPSPTGRGPGRG